LSNNLLATEANNRMKQKHLFRPYTCTIQPQQRVDFSSFFLAYQNCYCFMFYIFIFLWSFYCASSPVQLFLVCRMC